MGPFAIGGRGDCPGVSFVPAVKARTAAAKPATATASATTAAAPRLKRGCIPLVPGRRRSASGQTSGGSRRSSRRILSLRSVTVLLQNLPQALSSLAQMDPDRAGARTEHLSDVLRRVSRVVENDRGSLIRREQPQCRDQLTDGFVDLPDDRREPGAMASTVLELSGRGPKGHTPDPAKWLSELV